MRHRAVYRLIAALLALGVLTLVACESTGVQPVGTYTWATAPGSDLSAHAATATAAVIQATAEAVRRQQTVDAARVNLSAQETRATQEALAAAQAEATRVAAEATAVVQSTLYAEATIRSQSDFATLAAQLTTEAEFGATQTSVAGTMTAEAASLAATATDQAVRLTSTAEALSIEATGTAISLQATQSAVAAALERRRETLLTVLVLAAAVVAAVAAAAVLLGWDSLVHRPAANGPRTEVLQDGPCPPLTILPDGTVQFPLLSPEERTCTLTREQLNEVYDWAQTRYLDDRATRTIAERTSRLAPGLRSVRTLRRLDQAVTAGAISPRLAAVLEADWQSGGHDE